MMPCVKAAPSKPVHVRKPFRIVLSLTAALKYNVRLSLYRKISFEQLALCKYCLSTFSAQKKTNVCHVRVVVTPFIKRNGWIPRNVDEISTTKMRQKKV